MQSDVRRDWKSSKTFARPWIGLAIGLQLAHALVVFLLPHPTVPSNILQLCFPLLAVVVSLQQGTSNPNTTGRRSWFALAFAFSIWALAQGMFLYYMYAPPRTQFNVRPDDALWVLFGLPLLLAVTTSDQDADRVAWLDRLQAILFFAVLYLLVFSPSGSLPVTKAYMIQNMALIFCCFLRVAACQLARERRFFLNLAAFLVAYTTCESCGELLYKHGWQMGSSVDLTWTLPITLFLILVLRDAASAQQDASRGSRLVKAVGMIQGLNVAAVAFLSIAVAAILATRSPVLGGLSVAGAFALFAFRTNAREHLWHQAHDRLEETVLRDALTGLGNRLLLRKRLSEHLDSSEREQVVLLFADLDRFKHINDSLGHALGDRLLIEVGQRLRDAAAPNAVVCRLGGDEFVVLTAAESAEEAEQIGQALLQALHLPFHLGVHELRCTASIGVVLAAAGEDADDLLRTADHAMYRAKQLGRDRVQLFDAALRAQMSSRWRMESELRACIEADRIQVAFQPIYSVQLGGICGFEALARWSHPVLGSVPPIEFIGLAEESGLILALGAQILEKACTQMATWNRAWGTAFSVSVNVSPRQFADVGLMPSLLGILERSGLPASLLRLEITETALLTHESIVKHTLQQARAHGIRISLDDFGTGYSSLSFLLSLPVDEVKVDRSFVSHMHEDPDREELVRTVIHLGHSLGKSVVAEGVETEQDLLGLAKMGCECVQGYLISRPLSPEAIEADLSSIAGLGMPKAILDYQGVVRERRPAPETTTIRIEPKLDAELAPGAVTYR